MSYNEEQIAKMTKILLSEPAFLHALKVKCWNDCVKKVKGRYASAQIGETKCMKRCMDKMIQSYSMVREIYEKEFEEKEYKESENATESEGDVTSSTKDDL